MGDSKEMVSSGLNKYQSKIAMIFVLMWANNPHKSFGQMVEDLQQEFVVYSGKTYYLNNQGAVSTSQVQDQEFAEWLERFAYQKQ